MQHIHYFVAGQAQGVPIPVVVAIDRYGLVLTAWPSSTSGVALAVRTTFSRSEPPKGISLNGYAPTRNALVFQLNKNALSLNNELGVKKGHSQLFT